MGIEQCRGMIMTKKNRNTGGKIYVSIRSTNRNTARSGVGLNPAPCGYRKEANGQITVKNSSTKIVSKRSSFPPAEKHWPVRHRNCNSYTEFYCAEDLFLTL